MPTGLGGDGPGDGSRKRGVEDLRSRGVLIPFIPRHHTRGNITPDSDERIPVDWLSLTGENLGQDGLTFRERTGYGGRRYTGPRVGGESGGADWTPEDSHDQPESDCRRVRWTQLFHGRHVGSECPSMCLLVSCSVWKSDQPEPLSLTALYWSSSPIFTGHRRL